MLGSRKFFKIGLIQLKILAQGNGFQLKKKFIVIKLQAYKLFSGSTIFKNWAQLGLAQRLDRKLEPKKLDNITKGKDLSYKYGVNFLEASAKNYFNIEELFDQMVEHLVSIITNPQIPKKLSQLNNVKITNKDIMVKQQEGNTNGLQKKGCC
ncbi:hypothetical protein ABPG72_013515 [Tetrahymena utriculariae]